VVREEGFSHEIIGLKRFMGYSRVEEVVGVIARAFGIGEEVILRKSCRANIARKVALYFAQRSTGLSNGVIGGFFKGIWDSGVNKASARLKEEMVFDKKLSKLIEEIDSSFKALTALTEQFGQGFWNMYFQKISFEFKTVDFGFFLS